MGYIKLLFVKDFFFLKNQRVCYPFVTSSIIRIVGLHYAISHFFFTPIASSISFLCVMLCTVPSPVTPAITGIGVPGWLFAELTLGLGLLGPLTKGVGGRRLLGDAWGGRTSSIAETEKLTDLRLCPNRFVRLPNDERLGRK